MALSVVAVPALAQKIDVVEMVNGDRVTCELKKLDRGLLEAKTDSWGTLEIEWQEIARIESPTRFDVELRSGERLTGSLDHADAPRRVVVAGRSLAIDDVVFIHPLKASLWGQLDGSVDVGYSFASAGRATQWSLGADVRRHRELSDSRVSGDSFFSSKEGAEDTSRHSLYGDWVRYTGAKWGVVLLGQGQRNDELSLRLRVQAGGGALHRFVRTNRTLVSALGGLVFNNEVFTDDTPSTRTWELVLGTQFEYFVFNSPKTSITNYFSVFPNLSTGGRVRMELNTSARRELVKDLFVNVSLLDSYDNKPPVADARHHDFTLVTSIGWTF